MKKKIITALVALGIIISFFPQPTRAQVLSEEERASIIVEIQNQIADLMVQLIEALKLELSEKIKTEVTSQIVASNPPLVGNVPTPNMNNQNNITLGTASTTVPIFINVEGWVSGVAKIKGTPSADGGSGMDGGIVLTNNAPQHFAFEGLTPDTYTYSIKLFNRSYREANDGTASDVLFETNGSFVVPK